MPNQAASGRLPERAAVFGLADAPLEYNRLLADPTAAETARAKLRLDQAQQEFRERHRRTRRQKRHGERL
ncbi:hypothetical protein ACQEU3_37410 [Spirillospora sp. CA-253888]